MSKTNRTHTPAFKAQVALAALKGDRTISQIAAHFQIHVNLVAHQPPCLPATGRPR